MLFNFPEVFCWFFFSCSMVAPYLSILPLIQVFWVYLKFWTGMMQSLLQDKINWFWNYGVKLFQNIFRNSTCTHFQFLFQMNWRVAIISHGWSGISCQRVLFHLVCFLPSKSWTICSSSNTSNTSIWYCFVNTL